MALGVVVSLSTRHLQSSLWLILSALKKIYYYVVTY